MSTALILPDPQSMPIAQIAELAAQAEVIRNDCRERGDAEMARELHRRLEAFHRYVRDRQSRTLLERESRLTEMLIGELLGPAVVGVNQHNGRASNLEGLPYVERNRFRTLHENRELVVEMLDRGVTKRKALLDAIGAGTNGSHPSNGTAPARPKHKTYGAIVIDPPWDYGNTATRAAARDHYPTMTVDKLRDLPDLCEPLGASTDSHLYLWTTTSFLREAFQRALKDGPGKPATGRVYIETQCRYGSEWRVTGVADPTRAEYFAYVLGDELLVIAPRAAWHRAARQAWKNGLRKSCVRGSHPTKGVAIPIAALLPYLAAALEAAEEEAA